MWKYHFDTVPHWLRKLSLDFVDISAKYPDIFAKIADHDLFCASDYSGGTKDRPFYTASFLVATDVSTEKWNVIRTEIRKKWFSDNRKMSFKDLGDALRRKALSEYLEAANEINGVICTFAISRKIADRFCSQQELNNILSAGKHRAKWKAKPFRKMVTLASLQTFLIGGMIGNRKNIIWCTDDDDFTSTGEHITDLAMWMHAFRSLHMPHHTGHAVFHAASKITPGDESKFFEDLCSIPDLVAGAWSEAWSHAFASDFPEPGKPFLIDLSASSDKAQEIIRWFCRESGPLKKIHCIIGKPRSYKNEFSVLVAPSSNFPFE